MTGSKYWFTPKVDARAKLGAALEAMGAEWLRGKRLTPRDVATLVRLGKEAKEADQEQQAQLAAASAERSARAADASDLKRREDELEDVLVAVIADLEEDGQLALARFLARLSFARYRIRVTITAGDVSAGEEEEIKKVEQVERADIASRANGLAALCATLAKPGREPIMAALAERGIEATDIATLGADAQNVADQGRNVPLPVEATARESAAVEAQHRKWNAIRPLVARAVAGDPKLEALFASC